jgi:hypothetical protein
VVSDEEEAIVLEDEDAVLPTQPLGEPANSLLQQKLSFVTAAEPMASGQSID